MDTKDDELFDYLYPINEGHDMGIISEAGCPCIADPGAKIVSLAHEKNIKVIPLTGPSSIILALMASGLNGQAFTFHGYLPIDNMERHKKIKQLEEDSGKTQCTQIFIETPYRNNKMLETILKVCNPATQLCIASELTSANEWIKTKPIADWKNETTDLHKKPVIFLIQSA